MAIKHSTLNNGIEVRESVQKTTYVGTEDQLIQAGIIERSWLAGFGTSRWLLPYPYEILRENAKGNIVSHERRDRGLVLIKLSDRNQSLLSVSKFNSVEEVKRREAEAENEYRERFSARDWQSAKTYRGESGDCRTRWRDALLHRLTETEELLSGARYYTGLPSIKLDRRSLANALDQLSQIRNVLLTASPIVDDFEVRDNVISLRSR